MNTKLHKAYIETIQMGDFSSLHRLIGEQSDRIAFAREVLASPAPAGVDEASWKRWTQIAAQDAGLTPVFVVGRHTPDLGDAPVFVVGSAAPTFALDRETVMAQLAEIEQQATAAGARDILLQNVPAAAAGALIAHLGRTMARWGVVVSVPGARRESVKETFSFGTLNSAVTAAAALFLVNPRAKCDWEGDTTVTITVDPVAPFVFSHIDWLNVPPATTEQRPENLARWIRETKEISPAADALLDGIWEGNSVVITLKNRVAQVFGRPKTR